MIKRIIASVISLLAFNTQAASSNINNVVSDAAGKGLFNGVVLVSEDNKIIYQSAY